MATYSGPEQLKLNEVLATATALRDEVRGSLSLQAVGGSHIANDLDAAIVKLKALGAL